MNARKLYGAKFKDLLLKLYLILVCKTYYARSRMNVIISGLFRMLEMISYFIVVKVECFRYLIVIHMLDNSCLWRGYNAC